MMTAGPWRLDAIEILQIARAARYARRHIVDIIRETVATGELDVDRVEEGPTATEPVVSTDSGSEDGSGGGTALHPKPEEIGIPDGAGTVAPPPRPTQRVDVSPLTRTKLRRLLETLDELTPMTWRDGPLDGPRTVRRTVEPDPRPGRRRHARVEADGRQHRELPAVRGRLAA